MYPSSPAHLIHQGQRQFLKLFLADRCPLCQRPSPTALCANCRRQVSQCRSGNPCDRRQPGLTILSWGRYEGSLRQLIGQLKYEGHTDLAQILGIELGQTWLDQDSELRRSPRPLAIVPIPLHPSKLQQRGFNQADLIARWFCRLTRLPLHSQGLQRVQATQAQHSLGLADRQRNLARAFALNPSQISALRGTTVWLLDDIFTTGATAYSAAQTLRRSGVAVGGICTVARAMAWQEASDAISPAHTQESSKGDVKTRC
jgi:ComF family protein